MTAAEESSEAKRPTCILYGSTNWRLWSLRTEANLRMHGAWEILHTRPDTQSEQETFRKKHEVAIGIILSALSDAILESLPPYNNVQGLWQFLLEKYGGTNKTRSIQGLRAIHSTFYSYCSCVEDYISKIENGIREITSRLQSNERFPEWFLVDLLLANLDDSIWETFITLVLHEDKEITFKDLAARMIEQEKRMNHNESNAHLIKARKGKKSLAVPTCSHCGRKGHIIANCWDLHPDKKPAKYRENPASAAAAELPDKPTYRDFVC